MAPVDVGDGIHRLNPIAVSPSQPFHLVGAQTASFLVVFMQVLGQTGIKNSFMGEQR